MRPKTKTRTTRKEQRILEDVARHMKEDTEQEEIALKRMGTTPTDWLRWVVTFAEEDLDRLHREEVEAKGWDLRSLPRLVPSPPGIMRTWSRSGGPMEEAKVRLIHRRIADGLRSLFIGAWEMPPRKTWIRRISPDSSPKTRFQVTWDLGQEEEDVILGTVIDLVQGAGERLRICRLEGCGRLFIAHRKQRYCTPAHAQKDRNQGVKEGVRPFKTHRK